jgi:hypothetical protein
MHRLPLTVFKILGLSLVLMFLLDTTLVAIDTININSRVTNIAGVMQNEIARHNCMPDELRVLFEGQLEDIVDRSLVATGFRHNMADDLSPLNAMDYGEIATLEISVDMAPTRVFFANGGSRAGQEGPLLGRQILNYTLNYTYHIPCLRYLK